MVHHMTEVLTHDAVTLDYQIVPVTDHQIQKVVETSHIIKESCPSCPWCRKCRVPPTT